jgi:uracil-DNA glycosylase family protein
MGAEEWVPDRGDIEALRHAATACRGCELWAPATQVVFSAGEPHARMMLVGEQPGDVEDREGIPFVGPAGRLLQKALDDAGARRSDLYVTNAVKHFRFTVRGKRRIHATPQARHITACKPWLRAEIDRVQPALIVCLGATAGKSLLGNDFRVTQQRGVVMDRADGDSVRRYLATVHPSSIIRLKGDDYDQAYAGFVADLRTAVGSC